MPKQQRIGDLEIEQDMDFQRREWIVQRIGWGLIAIILLAALLGLFGSGPLSIARADDARGQLHIEYGRFARLQSPTKLTLALGPGTIRDGQARIWLSRDYLAHMEVEAVTPPPLQVESGAGRLYYVFLVADASQPTIVEYNLKTDAIGLVSGQAGYEGSEPLDFAHFIYP